MATYGGIQQGMTRIEIDPETGLQRVVTDDVEVSPKTEHESIWSNPYYQAAFGMAAAPGLIAAAPAIGGALGGGGSAAATGSAAASSAVPSAAAGAGSGGGGMLGSLVGNLFGSGGTMGKLMTGGKIIGGILDQAAKNRGEERGDSLYAHQLSQQGARDEERAAFDRAELERKNLEYAQKQRAINFEAALRAQRALNYTPASIDASQFRSKPKKISMTGGKGAAPSEAERAVLEQIVRQAMDEINNPVTMPSVPTYRGVGPVQMPRAGILERVAGPAALAMRLLGQDEDEPVRRPHTVGDATGGSTNA